MNEISKKILIQKMDAILSKIIALPDNDPLFLEISSVTEPGNISAIFANIKSFLETGSVSDTIRHVSSLPAMIFALPEMNRFLTKELASDGISDSDIASIASEFLEATKNLH